MSIDMPAITLGGINHSNNVLILAQNILSRAYVVITVGAYTDASLATEIQTQLNAGAGAFGITTWSCTFAGDKYTIANASTLNFYIASDSLINITLGFDAPGQTAVSATLTSDGVTSLNSSNYVLTVSRSLNPFQGVPSTIEYARIVHTVDANSNIIILNDSITDYTITIADGQYNLYELAIEMQTQFGIQAAASVAHPMYVEYILNTSTNQVDFQIRAESTITLSGTFVKTILNYYISDNTTNTEIRIYSAPLSAEAVLIINPAKDTANVSTITTPLTTYKWRGAAKSKQGKIYFAPFNADSVLIVNTFDNSGDTTTMPISAAGDGFDTTFRWSEAITAPNDKIYFVPYFDRYWAVVDPSNDTIVRDAIPALNGFAEVGEITEITTIADVTSSLSGKYFTINSTTSYYVWFNVDNGSIDPIPGGLTEIEVNISVNNTAETVANALQNVMDNHVAFSATVFGPIVTINNVISGAVTNAADVDTGFTLITILEGSSTTGGATTPINSSGVLVGTKIYGVPFRMPNRIGVVDTTNNGIREIVDMTVLANPFPHVPMYSSGVYVPTHNKIYCAPLYTRNSILVISNVGGTGGETVSELLDPLIPTQPVYGPAYELYSDMVLAPNGKIYCVPFSEDFVLVLDTATDPPTFSSPVGLQGLGTVASLYTFADISQEPSPVNNIVNARKWGGGILTPDQKIWLIPLLDNRVIIIDTLTDTYTVSQANIPGGSNKWLGQILSNSRVIYEDSLRKTTAGHIIHKTYLNNPIGGRIVDRVGMADIVSFQAGYDIDTIDMRITDPYGNSITEFAGNFSAMLRISHQ